MKSCHREGKVQVYFQIRRGISIREVHSDAFGNKYVEIGPDEARSSAEMLLLAADNAEADPLFDENQLDAVMEHVIEELHDRGNYAHKGQVIDAAAALVAKLRALPMPKENQ